MKKILFAIICMLFAIPVVTVYAQETREIRLYLYSEYPDCVFLVNWENMKQNAEIEIVDPNGTVISADASNTVFGKGRAYVSVGNASYGYWTVRVSGNAMGTIGVSGGSRKSVSEKKNAISRFDVEFSGGYIHFNWNVKARQDTVNVTIYAVQGDDGSYGTRTVWSDYSAEPKGASDVLADELNTGLYRFLIQAYNGDDVFVLSTEEPIYIVQSNAPEKLNGIRAGSVDGSFYVVWDVCDCDRYLLTLYDDNSLDVIGYQWLYDHFYVLSLDYQMDRFQFSVAAVRDNVYGEFELFPVVITNPSGSIVFPENSVIRERSMEVKISCPDDSSAGIYLDGMEMLEGIGSGDYDIYLSEGSHEIVAYVKDKNGNIKTFCKSVTVDWTPPVVRFTNAGNRKTQNSAITLEGTTEPGAVVMINGVEQILGNGTFTAKVALEKGVNAITITAYDAAGNKSVQTITVERSGALNGSGTMFIAPGVLVLLLSVYYVILNRRMKGAKINEKIS